jgi:hypothetical protein
LYTPEGPPPWARYRCWVTDFRYADLTRANFAGTALAGADFEGADLTHANFCRADVSRANFRGAKGLSREMLETACVGGSEDAPPGSPQEVVEDAQPFGLDFKIPRCRVNPTAEQMCPDSSHQ